MGMAARDCRSIQQQGRLISQVGCVSRRQSKRKFGIFGKRHLEGLNRVSKIVSLMTFRFTQRSHDGTLCPLHGAGKTLATRFGLGVHSSRYVPFTPELLS